MVWIVRVPYPHIILTLLDIDPFHRSGLRGDFCRQSVARCAAVRDTVSLRDAAGGKRRPALAGGANRRGRGRRELLGGACPPFEKVGSRRTPCAAPRLRLGPGRADLRP